MTISKHLRIGEKINKLTIINLDHINDYMNPTTKYINKQYFYLCRCECGNETVILESNLKRGTTKSCGCLKIGKNNISYKHGLRNSRIYKILQGMIIRCYDKNRIQYKDWGGRGIKVCDEWLGSNGVINFYNWSMANGYQDNLTIDRIDNEGNYEPNNCRWTDKTTQALNTRLYKNNKSGFKGVFFCKNENKYKSYITYHKKRINLGTFEKIEDAIKARNKIILI